jgi:hypothetical protein
MFLIQMQLTYKINSWKKYIYTFKLPTSFGSCCTLCYTAEKTWQSSIDAISRCIIDKCGLVETSVLFDLGWPCSFQMKNNRTIVPVCQSWYLFLLISQSTYHSFSDTKADVSFLYFLRHCSTSRITRTRSALPDGSPAGDKSMKPDPKGGSKEYFAAI